MTVVYHEYGKHSATNTLQYIFAMALEFFDVSPR